MRCSRFQILYDLLPQLLKLTSSVLEAPLQDMQATFDRNGEIATTVANFYRPPSAGKRKREIPLHCIETLLESFTLAGKDKQKMLLFSKFFNMQPTEKEVVYFMRLLNKNLRIKAGPAQVLKALDPRAKKAYDLNPNLEHIIRAYHSADPSSTVSCGEGKGTNQKLVPSVQVTQPLKPMLAKPCKTYEQCVRACPNGFFTEVKYDGERVQIHKKGDTFWYFSRTLKPVKPEKVADLTPYLNKAFASCDTLIVDAEILMMDTQTHQPLPFGSLNKHKRATFFNAQTGVFVFDLLFCNGQNLCKTPLSERRRRLETEIQTVTDRVMLSECRLLHKARQLELEMGKAIQLGLEGLILKQTGGLYEPGKRKWLKMKKDYLKGGNMADSADLVVLGGYLGTGSMGGKMSVFLMGVFDGSTWRTVCKCGNGHDNSAIDTINKELARNMTRTYNRKEGLPSWLCVHSSLVPDFVVRDPTQSPVWEIAGAEFTHSSKHTATDINGEGISIRFPRVLRVRDDKTSKDATSLEELRQLFSTGDRSGKATRTTSKKTA